MGIEEDAEGQEGVKMSMSTKQLQIPPYKADEDAHLITGDNVNRFVYFFNIFISLFLLYLSRFFCY